MLRGYVTIAAFLAVVASPALALRPPPPVPDYISLMPSLEHCNETPDNVGGFSVSRVRCGCNDNEFKVGKRIGSKFVGPWRVQEYIASCVMEDIEPRRLRHKGKKYNDFEYDYYSNFAPARRNQKKKKRREYLLYRL